jgi:hypothetical protein
LISGETVGCAGLAGIVHAARSRECVVKFRRKLRMLAPVRPLRAGLRI